MEPITVMPAQESQGFAIPADPSLVYGINYEPGMRAEVRTNARGFSVSIVDRDAEERLPCATIFGHTQLARAIELANDYAGLPNVPPSEEF